MASGLVGHQTFWMVGVPSRPLGRTSITTIRMTKTMASLKVDETYAVTNDSVSPIIRPPSIAPGMLPIPPMTAAMNALSPALEAHQW